VGKLGGADGICVNPWCGSIVELQIDGSFNNVHALYVFLTDKTSLEESMG